MSYNDGGGHSPPGAPAANESSHRQEAAHEDRSDSTPVVPVLATVPDDEAAIRGVLSADDAGLRQVLRADRYVRHALRWRPNDGTAEQARTLVAAARVEKRRRAGAGVLAAVLGAARAGGTR